MLGKLKAIHEGNGKTLLDNMLFFWTNELGEGGKHTYINVPYVLAGSCQGQMQTGRYIDFWGDDPPIPASAVQPYDFANIYGKGAPHNKLMVSFLNMMGVPNDGTFGMKDYTGNLPGLITG